MTTSDPTFYGLTAHEANQALGEFCCTPLTPLQAAVLEAASYSESEQDGEFLEWQKIAFANSTARQRTYTSDLNAMALVRAKMSTEQKAQFARRILRLYFNNDKSFLSDVFAVIDADAGTQAGIALQVLRDELPEAIRLKLDLAREHEDAVQLTGG